MSMNKTETSGADQHVENDNGEMIPTHSDSEIAMQPVNKFKTHQQWIHSYHANDGLPKYDGRDLMGRTSTPKWPHNAKVALNFCIHYEEGGEVNTLHGDNSRDNDRDMVTESIYEYGSRSGFWRLHRLFTERKIPCTLFAVGMALERNPSVCHVLKRTKEWEIASQGYRAIDYKSKENALLEREHMDRSVEIQDRIFGQRPVGFFTPEPNTSTRQLIIEEGGFQYDSNSYCEDLPYWITDYSDRPHLVIPYSLTENDLVFEAKNGFATGKQFGDHLKATLKEMIEEGRSGNPKLMTVALHCRLASPGHVSGLVEFLDFLQSFAIRSDVWIATREQIADLWNEKYFPMGAGLPVKPAKATPTTKSTFNSLLEGSYFSSMSNVFQTQAKISDDAEFDDAANNVESISIDM